MIVRLVVTLEIVKVLTWFSHPCKDLFLQLAICVPLDVVPLVFGLWGNTECFACYLDHQAGFDYYLIFLLEMAS